MIEWMGANAETLGAGIVAAAGIAYAAWMKIQAMRATKSNTDAKVAIAESQKEVYEQMKERLASQEAHLSRLQAEVDKLRENILERDTKIHHLELYVQDLQYVLHQHGIDIPPMRK